MLMNQRLRHPISACLLSTPLVLALPATAGEFRIGEIEGSFTSNISIGSSWRTEGVDPALVFSGNFEGGRASTSVTDDGNLNFEKGAQTSFIVKGLHQLELQTDNIGVFTRFKYWYDIELTEGDRPFGNSLNAYTPNQPLEDSGFNDFARTRGAQLLDAYVYGDFNLGSMPGELRIGEQVVSWGESTFIQNGINIINPVDVTAFRRPGVEIKEGLLPVGMVYTSLGLTETLNVEAFYQWEWQKSPIDGCGTFFSTVDVAADGCNFVTVQPVNVSDQAALANGLFITRTDDREPDNQGQFGISLKYFAEELNFTEFGLYFVNYHSRLPLLGGTTSSNVLLGGEAGTGGFFIPGDPLGGNPQYFAEFPDDIKLYGFSFNTNVGGFALSGEASYRQDLPAQINTTELLQAGVAGAPWSTLTPTVLTTAPGQDFAGFERFDMLQLQATVVKFFERVMGADRLSVVAEVGFASVQDVPDQSELRFGRSATFGIGDFGDLELAPGLSVNCEGNEALGLVPNPSPENCTRDGFLTDTSWGYRLRLEWQYLNAFKGINLRPSIAWSHDVDGYYPEPAPIFVEGRQVLGLRLAGDYNNRYFGDIAYTRFSGGDYNVSRDRDFFSLSFGVSF
ncbi:MAG: DUF1302 domain-containing protein [Pseudomonadota bacterium]